MAGKAHNGSAEIANRTWACVAGAIACVLGVLAFAGDAFGSLPSVPALAGTATQPAQSAAAAVAPVSRAAAAATGAASADGEAAAPSGPATSAVREAVQSTSGPVAAAGKTAAEAAGATTEAATSVAAPVAKSAAHTVEQALTGTSGTIHYVAATGETAGKALAPLVETSSKGAGALLAQVSKDSRGLESAVSDAGSALQDAAVALPVASGRRLGAPSGGARGARHVELAPAPSIAASKALAGLQERLEGRGASQLKLPSSLPRVPPGPSGAGGITVGPSHEARAARASARWRAPLGTAPMPMPGGVPSSAAGAFGVAASVCLTLAALLLLGVPRAIRTLRLSAEPRLAAAFVLIPERPG